MLKRQLWILGLTAVGLAITAPVQAAPDLIDGAFILAKRDQGDDLRQDRRDDRKDDRRSSRREGERDEPQGYGYGYERRQQERPADDNRSRGRR